MILSDESVEAMRIKAHNQVFHGLPDFMENVIVPWFKDASLSEFRLRFRELIIMTGPAVKQNPNNSIVCVPSTVQTIEEFCKDYLRHDKSSDAYQLHLSLSEEAHSTDDDRDLLPASPTRIHKKPSALDLGSMEGSVKKEPEAPKKKIKSEQKGKRVS